MQKGHLADASVPIEIYAQRLASAAAAGVSEIGLPPCHYKQVFRLGAHLLAFEHGQALQIREAERGNIHRPAECLEKAAQVERAASLCHLYELAQRLQLRRLGKIGTGAAQAQLLAETLIRRPVAQLHR